MVLIVDQGAPRLDGNLAKSRRCIQARMAMCVLKTSIKEERYTDVPLAEFFLCSFPKIDSGSKEYGRGGCLGEFDALGVLPLLVAK